MKTFRYYNNQINFLIFCVFSIMTLISTPITIIQAADSTYTVLAPLPCIEANGIVCEGGNGAVQKTVSFRTYVQYAMNLLIALAAVTAVAMIVYGGLKYMTTTIVSGKEEGREIIENAIKGLLLVLCSYLILRTIDPRLVEIPTTLVKKLEIRSELTKDLNIDFIDQLQKEANKYQFIGQQFIETARQAKNSIVVLEKQKTNIENELDFLYTHEILPDNDPKILALERQLALTNDSIRDARAKVQSDLAQSIMNNGGISQTLKDIELKIQNESFWSASVTADIIYKEIYSGIDFIEETRKKRVDSLKTIGAVEYIDGPNGVNDSANAAKISLNIQGSNIITNKAIKKETTLTTLSSRLLQNKIVVVVGSQELGSVQKVNNDLSGKLNTLSRQITTVKDPVLRRNLEVQLQNSRELVKQKFGN